MMAGYGNKPFGLHEIKLVRGTTVVSLTNAMTMSFKERVKSGELSGDDKTVAVVATCQPSTGTTPNRTTTLNADAGTPYPYFQIYGKSLGDGIDDVHVKIYKAKLTEPLEGEFSDGQFFVTSCSGLAVDDGTNGIYDVVQNETATSLPTS